MSQPPATSAAQLESLNRKLQQLHAQLLQAEREFHPPMGGRELLDRLVSDPAWAWLRPLSSLIADIDHVLAQSAEPNEQDRAVVAAHVRGLLAGEGDLLNEQFLGRYRPLLQTHPELTSAHGELKGLLRTMPAESENESERLHARHQWNMRCKHRSVAH
jgi:hypothetical protein